MVLLKDFDACVTGGQRKGSVPDAGNWDLGLYLEEMQGHSQEGGDKLFSESRDNSKCMRS